MIGPNARLRVAREPESGLELAAKVMDHVKERRVVDPDGMEREKNTIEWILDENDNHYKK